MELNVYLELKNEKPTPWASKNGLNVSTVWNILKKKRKPSAKTALAIEKITKGAVTFHDLTKD